VLSGESEHTGCVTERARVFSEPVFHHLQTAKPRKKENKMSRGMCVMTHYNLRVQEFFLFFKERKNAKIAGGFP